MVTVPPATVWVDSVPAAGNVVTVVTGAGAEVVDVIGDCVAELGDEEVVTRLVGGVVPPEFTPLVVSAAVAALLAEVVVVVSTTTMVGASPDWTTVEGTTLTGWTTRSRTWETATHESPTATAADTIHIAANFTHFGIDPLSPTRPSRSHRGWL